jgi:tape measure domain-containing protein
MLLGRALYSLGQSLRADAVQSAAMGMRAFDGLTAALQREAAMLERIHGPTIRYAEDLQVLDALLAKNTITVEQYADQVARLNQQIERTPRGAPGGGHAGADVGMLGGLPGGNVMAAFAGGGAVAGAIEGVKSLGGALLDMADSAREARERMVELKDHYTELTNAAQKFTDSSHDASQILDEQRDLAFRLHQPLRAVLETYDAVRDGTDDLNLSHRQQIALTENLGRALILSNKPLQEAGGIMERLSYAMAAGTISGEELKRTMRQVPELAELWTTSFNTTRTGLIKMVEDGKVSVIDLVNVTIRSGEQLGESWNKQVRTVGQWRDAVKQSYETALARGENQTDAMTAAIRENVDANISWEERIRTAEGLLKEHVAYMNATVIAHNAVATSQDEWTQSTNRALASTKGLGQQLDQFIDQWRQLQTMKSDHLVAELNSVADVVDHLQTTLPAVARGLAAIVAGGKLPSADPWGADIDLWSPEKQERAKQAREEAKRRREEQEKADSEYAARAYGATSALKA